MIPDQMTAIAIEGGKGPAEALRRECQQRREFSSVREDISDLMSILQKVKNNAQATTNSEYNNDFNVRARRIDERRAVQARS